MNCLFVDFEVICVLGWGAGVCWGGKGVRLCVRVCAGGKGVCWGEGEFTFGEHSSETIPLSIRWCIHN